MPRTWNCSHRPAPKPSTLCSSTSLGATRVLAQLRASSALPGKLRRSNERPRPGIGRPRQLCDQLRHDFEQIRHQVCARPCQTWPLKSTTLGVHSADARDPVDRVELHNELEDAHRKTPAGKWRPLDAKAHVPSLPHPAPKLLDRRIPRTLEPQTVPPQSRSASAILRHRLGEEGTARVRPRAYAPEPAAGSTSRKPSPQKPGPLPTGSQPPPQRRRRTSLADPAAQPDRQPTDDREHRQRKEDRQQRAALADPLAQVYEEGGLGRTPWQPLPRIAATKLCSPNLDTSLPQDATKGGWQTTPLLASTPRGKAGAARTPGFRKNPLIWCRRRSVRGSRCWSGAGPGGASRDPNHRRNSETA